MAQRERYEGTLLFHARNGLGFGRMADAVAGKTFAYCTLYAVFDSSHTSIYVTLYQIKIIERYHNTNLVFSLMNHEYLFQ